MGIKMVAKYRGDCKVCGSEWKVGEQIYYQKDPKVICTDEPCYSEQGGSITKSFQSSFTKPSQSYQRPKIKFVVPDVEVPDGVKACAEMLQQTIVVAHHLAISMYPDLDTEDQTFGQIRSKLADQILAVCQIREPKG
jgi:hypothetical protein